MRINRTSDLCDFIESKLNLCSETDCSKCPLVKKYPFRMSGKLSLADNSIRGIKKYAKKALVLFFNLD